jgi:uncharacterized membrane protein
MAIQGMAARSGMTNMERRGTGGDGSERLARGLGWISIGLGVAELVAPHALARGIGLRGGGTSRTLTRVCGLRELAAGTGILSERRPAAWMWARVVGDVMDLALLGAGFAGRRTNRARLAAATAAVAGVTVVDALCAQRLTALGRVSMEITPDGALRVRRRVTVNRPPEALYGFWREFSNAPRFMERVEEVRPVGERRTHWRARGPAGMNVEWDSEVVDERPNELIAWRSVDALPFQHSGVVRFEPAPAGRGTVVTVEMEYAPPGGGLTATAAKLLGYAPEQQLQEDLRRFKQLMETGLVVVAQPFEQSHHSLAAGGGR